MPRSPSVPHTRLPIGASGSPQDPNHVDLEPFNPHIIARSGVHGVCLVHHAYRPCNGCLAAEIDSLRVAQDFTAPRARKVGAL